MLHLHALPDHLRPHTVGDPHFHALVQAGPHLLVLSVVGSETPLRAFPVFLVLLVGPLRLVHGVVARQHHHGADIGRFLVLPAPQILVHQRVVAVDEIGVGLHHVLWVMAANGIIPPAPEVKRVWAILDIIAQIQRQGVEITVLVDGQVLVPADLVLDQVFPPPDLSVDKGAVVLTVDVDDLPGLRNPRLFDEQAPQAVELAQRELPEQDPQPAGVIKNIVRKLIIRHLSYTVSHDDSCKLSVNLFQ